MCVSHSVVCDSLRYHGLQPARLVYPWGFSSQEYWSGLPCPPSGHLPNPGIEPRSPTLQVDSLPSEPPRKPKNIWVGSLSLLQGIFLTQGLLHCRQILYQLNYQGSPNILWKVKVAQLCPTLYDPMDYPVHGMLQARILEWVAFPSSRGSSQPRDWTQVSYIADSFFTSWDTGETPIYCGGVQISY